MRTDSVIDQVIVKRSDMVAAQDPKNASKLVFAIDNFVHRMTRDGFYSRHELPARAVLLYRAVMFHYSVEHGGPQEVIETAGTERLRFNWSLVLEGLAAMGAEGHLAIAKEMTGWSERYPNIETLRAAPKSEHQLLDQLERRLSRIEGATPIAVLAARWITSWPELKVVDDGDYDTVIQQLAAKNPQFGIGQLWKDVRRLERQLHHPKEVALAFACTQAPKSPDGATEIMLLHGVHWDVEIDGESQIVVHVRTSSGLRYGLLTDTHAALYERIEVAPFREKQSLLLSLKSGGFPKPHNALVGKKLSHIPAELTAEVIALQSKYNFPIAIATLLRRVGALEGKHVFIAPLRVKREAPSPVIRWAVACSRPVPAMTAETGPIGTKIWRSDGSQVIGSLAKHEIDELAQQVAALKQKLEQHSALL